MAAVNYRTINIDALDPDSPANFDLSTLRPSVQPLSSQDVQTVVSQIRQQLRSGDGQGALTAALEGAPYGADAKDKDTYTSLVTETLQSIRASDMTPYLTRLSEGPGGVELLDVLMKYLYKGMSASHTAAISSGTPSRDSTPTKPRVTPQTTGFSQVGGRNFSSGGGPESGGQAMSVLLSWHEKLVEIAGPGSIVRVMSDRRTV